MGQKNGVRAGWHTGTDALRQATKVGRAAHLPYVLVWTLNEMPVLEHAAG